MGTLKNKFSGYLVISLNIILIFASCYLFTIIGGKYYFNTKKFSLSARIFNLTGIQKGALLSLLESNQYEKAEKIVTKSDNPDFKGIFAWAKHDFDEAERQFEISKNDRYFAYALYKKGERKRISDDIKDQKLRAHFLIDEKKYSEATEALLKINDDLGLFRVFLELKNYPTAIYYLLKKPHPNSNLLARLFLGKETEEPLILPPYYNYNDYENWVNYLKGQYASLRQSGKNPQLLSTVDFLENDLVNFFKNSTETVSFLNQVIPNMPLEDHSHIVDQLQKQFEKLKVYTVVPEGVEAGEYSRSYLMLFAICLGLLITFFAVSLFYLYRKYQANLELQRQKDLEKMDALSLAKMQRMEAKKKRDKTELNVSSFVTLNIQLEVLDLAFSKLGLRVDTNKLAEQIEKTKIPNISFKVYTISNAYGLNVKMLSIKPEELPKQKQHGAVILVLKGDLVALLKNADNQNAYLQFSQKDSRKVPFSALKLSWEGNIIVLNI